MARKSAYMLKPKRVVNLFGSRKIVKTVDELPDGKVEITFEDGETIRRPRTAKLEVE